MPKKFMARNPTRRKGTSFESMVIVECEISSATTLRNRIEKI
jgi:hypothetical protein